MICEFCGTEISNETQHMFVCNGCLSTYIVDNENNALIKYLVNDKFKSIYDRVKSSLLSLPSPEKEKTIQQLLSAYHNVPALWNMLGVIYRSQNRLKEAGDCYSEALKINPKYGQLYLNRAILKYNQNDYIGALDDGNKAMVYMSSSDDNYATLLGNYALFVGKNGDLTHAEELLQKAYEKGYGNCDAIKKMLGITIETKQQSNAGGLLGKLRGGINSIREDAAIKRAYRIEQEKRKPHIKRIEHERPLTEEEQATIDRLETEMNSKSLQSARNGKGFLDCMIDTQPYMEKISEIHQRAIWIEEITIPPEVDPSVPIHIDEEMIRKSVRKF